MPDLGAGFDQFIAGKLINKKSFDFTNLSLEFG